MNTRTAAPVILTVSLVVLMSGCAGAAAQGGQVTTTSARRRTPRPSDIARGHVIARDELSPNRVERARRAEAVEQAAQSDAARAFSAEARRELHAQSVEPSIATSVEPRRPPRAARGPAESATEQPFERRMRCAS